MSHERPGTEAAADGVGAGSPAPTPRVVSRRLLHKGRKFDFEVLRVRRPGGTELEREVVRHPGAVVVVAVKGGGASAEAVLIRNFRISVEEQLLECCAGTLEPGEDPAVCAGRELVEETGYRAGRIEPLGWFYTSPGLSDERMHAFVATGLSHVGQDLEDDESIEVECVPVGETLRMIERGDIRDGKSIAALLMADRRGLLAGRAEPGGC